MIKNENIKGKTFFNLTVIEFLRRSNKGNVWLCKCVCGNDFECTTGRLNEGNIKSCGCKKIKPVLTHGMSKNRMYSIWQNMKNRCYNSNVECYHSYGGRGISVCEDWLKDFTNFYNDMYEGYSAQLTLDRRNVDGNYNKENCKWSDVYEQSRNRRTNHWIEHEGVKMIKVDWAKKLKISHVLITRRMKEGWSFNEVYTYYSKKK